MSKEAQVTRVRVEVAGTDINAVKDMLIAEGRFNRERNGGTWAVEDDSFEIQQAKGGYWGRVTLRRQDAQSDPVSAG